MLAFATARDTWGIIGCCAVAIVIAFLARVKLNQGKTEHAQLAIWYVMLWLAMTILAMLGMLGYATGED